MLVPSIVIYCFLSGVLAQHNITSTPPGQKLATGFMNYTITAALNREVLGRESCDWYFNLTTRLEVKHPFYGETQSGGYGCSNVPSIDQHFDEYDERCVHTSTHIVSTLRIYRLPAGTLCVKIVCTGDNTILATHNATIQNCSDTNLSAEIAVNPNSQTYGEEATFSCRNGGRLFYSDGKLRDDTTTQCLAIARWSGEENLQCWKVPDPVTLTAVDIDEFPSVKEGSRLNLNCSYENVFPFGNASGYFIGNDFDTIPKGEVFTSRVLTRNDNNKPVKCQAVTPYTDVINGSGISSVHTLNVQYKPYQDREQADTSCEWETNRTGVCDVMFSSNPPATFVSLKNNGTVIQNETTIFLSSDGEKQMFHFTKSNVVAEDEGTYELNLTSTAFPDTSHTFMFNITVNTGPPETDSNIGLIAGVCAAAGTAVLFIIIFCCVYRKNQRSQKHGVNEGREDVTGTSAEKEERINPLYDTRPMSGQVSKPERQNDRSAYSDVSPDRVEEAYSDVRVNNKDSSEKVTRVNPIYVAADGAEPCEAAYAAVDFENKLSRKPGAKGSGPSEAVNLEMVNKAYAEDDTKQQSATQEHKANSRPNDTYSEVKKFKKKKKSTAQSHTGESAAQRSDDE